MLSFIKTKNETQERRKRSGKTLASFVFLFSNSFSKAVEDVLVITNHPLIMAGVLINAIFDDSEPQSLGFVYSTGVASLRSETNYEFIWFGRRNLVESVCHTMNFLASRIESGHAVSGNQTVESRAIIWRISALSESRNQELLDEYAVKCLPSTTLLELAPGFSFTPAADDTCFVEHIGGDDFPMICLSRKLPSGRIIRVDTQNNAMLTGGLGIAHVNMNNGDDRFTNLKLVTEQEARQMLMAFQE